MPNKQTTTTRAFLYATLFTALTASPSFAQFGGEMPPPEVGVIELKAEPVPVINELPGRVAATRLSEVRARVSGILQERVFEQGALVKEGDVLYRIDPRLFRVRVASAQAALDKAKAIAENARQQFERQKTLRERNVASGIDYDTASVNVAQANADVASAEAALEEAQINLEYTEVRAPITGVIGGALITEGALVTADGTSSLALIQQLDPVYVDFTQSAQDLLGLKRAVADGTLAGLGPNEANVSLVFDDGSLFGKTGRLLFSSANVDPTTGQVTLRAEFPNTNSDLLPGMYVRVRIEQAIREGGIKVPQRAILRDDTGMPQIYVVGADGKAELRSVTLGQTLATDWVVDNGLKAGETIVVDGVQKVQPGGTVVPKPWNPSTPDAQQAAPAAAKTSE